MIHFPRVTSRILLKTSPDLLFLCLSPSLFAAFLGVVKGSATRPHLKLFCSLINHNNQPIICPQIPVAATLQVAGQPLWSLTWRRVSWYGRISNYEKYQFIPILCFNYLHGSETFNFAFLSRCM